MYKAGNVDDCVALINQALFEIEDLPDPVRRG